MGKFKKGLIPWNKGKKGTHFSSKTEFKKGQHYSKKTEFKKGQIAWNKGLTKETNELVKKNADAVKATHWMKQLPKEKRTEITRAMRFSQKYPSNPSSIELMLRKALNKIGIEFEPHKKLLNITEVDIFIEPNIVIYCDGDYWHANPSKYNYNELDNNQEDHVERDTRNNILLEEKGYIVLRFWESEIKLNPDLCAKKIAKIVPKTIYFGDLNKILKGGIK